MTYLSDQTRETLGSPRSLRHSPVKLVALTIFLAAVAVLPLWLLTTGTLELPVGEQGRVTRFVLLGISAIGGIFFVIRVIPKWAALRRPVVVIAQEGLTFPGKPLMPWDDIVENEWRIMGSGWITTGAKLVVRTHTQRVTREVITLNCNAKEYVRLCELYQQAGAQQPQARSSASN